MGFEVGDIVWYYSRVIDDSVIGEIIDLIPHQYEQYQEAIVRGKDLSEDNDISILQLNIRKKCSKIEVFLFNFKNYYD